MPLNNMTHHTSKAALSWISSAARLRLGVKGEILYGFRRGEESVIGDPSTNDYPVLAWLTKYEQENRSARLNIIAEYVWQGVSLSAEPFISLSQTEERYIYPAQIMDMKSLEFGVNIRLTNRFSHWLLQADIAGGGRMVLNPSLTMPVANMPEEIVDMMRYSFARESSDRAGIGAGIRADRTVKSNLSLFLSGQWKYLSMNENISQNTLRICIGMVF